MVPLALHLSKILWDRRGVAGCEALNSQCCILHIGLCLLRIFRGTLLEQIRGFINVFNRKATGFELNFFIRRTFL